MFFSLLTVSDHLNKASWHRYFSDWHLCVCARSASAQGSGENLINAVSLIWAFSHLARGMDLIAHGAHMQHSERKAKRIFNRVKVGGSGPWSARKVCGSTPLFAPFNQQCEGENQRCKSHNQNRGHWPASCAHTRDLTVKWSVILLSVYNTASNKDNKTPTNKKKNNLFC